MKLSPLDWSIIIGYGIFALMVGLFFVKRASGSIKDFFVSGRSLPWWLAGTSMVATTFAADTPLAVTGFVSRQGIAGNWFWWSAALSGMMAVFLFARLWRRAEVITDAELIELRYSGRPAAILRGFKGFYYGVLINCFTMAWVIKAMTKIMSQAFQWNESSTLSLFVLCWRWRIQFFQVFGGSWLPTCCNFYWP